MCVLTQVLKHITYCTELMSSFFLDFTKIIEMNVETGETGVGYTGKFILPCKTHDVIKGNRSYVVMVACLEFPHRAPWLVCLISYASTKHCIQYIQ